MLLVWLSGTRDLGSLARALVVERTARPLGEPFDVASEASAEDPFAGYCGGAACARESWVVAWTTGQDRPLDDGRAVRRPFVRRFVRD